MGEFISTALQKASQQQAERLLHPSQPIPLGSVSGPMVGVPFEGRVLLLPERALGVGASALRVASGEHVRLLDYADSVGPLLEALERQGLIVVLA